MNARRRFVTVGAAVVFTGGLAVTGITAFACTPSASIALDRAGTVVQGETATGSGSQFSTAPGSSPVQIHFNSLSGNVVWSGGVSASGTISFSFPTSNIAPGYYFISASQTDSAGKTVTMNTPRTNLNVNAAPAPAPAPPPPAPAPVQPPPAPAPVQPPAPAQPPAPVQQQPGPAPASVNPPVSATGQQAPAAVVQAPAVDAQQPAAAPAAADVVTADPLQPPRQHVVAAQGASEVPVLQQPAAGDSGQSAHSTSHSGAVLALALVIGVIVLTVGAAAFVVAGRREQGAEARTHR